MIKIKIPEYTITLTDNNLKMLASLLKSHYRGEKLYIITDENVANLYKNKVSEVLSNFTCHFTIIPPGETSKSLTQYHCVVKKLLRAGMKRDDFIVALGGGVVGDLAGFVASTLFRGVKFAHVPTTLLAQVDSSIGGKVAIDLAEGKNLLGAFYNPTFVFIDTVFLNTLTERELRNGVAEMIKAGLIKDSSLYKKLKQQVPLDTSILAQAIEVKRHFILKDPFDQFERMLLNFGHTFGHAIEKVHHYQTYKHGEAISYGMLIALEIGIKLGLTPRPLYDEIKELLLSYNLVKEPFLQKEAYLTAISNDKKALSSGFHFILLKNIGEAIIHPLKVSDLA